MEIELLKQIGPVAQLGSFGLVCWIMYWAISQITKLIAENQKLTERAVRAIDDITHELQSRPCMKDMADVDRDKKARM